MPLIASYKFKDTFIHRLDPRTKLVWVAGLVVIAVVTNQTLFLAGLIVLTLAVSAAGGIDLKRFVPITKIVGAFAIGIILIQTIFHDGGAVFFPFGPVALHEEGFWLAIYVVLRLYCFILAFMQFLMWTHPTDLSLVLVKAKMPYRYALLLGITLRFLPVMEAELDSILAAQEARGLELRNPVRRAINLIPVGLPFCLRTLRRTNEVALAMELRGYGYRDWRTFVRTIRLRKTDYAMVGMIIVLVSYYIAIRPG